MKKLILKREPTEYGFKEMVWYFKEGFISKVWNDYVPEGVEPSWEYWIYKWKEKGDIGNRVIDNVLTLKEAKKIAHLLT